MTPAKFLLALCFVGLIIIALKLIFAGRKKNEDNEVSSDPSPSPPPPTHPSSVPVSKTKWGWPVIGIAAVVFLIWGLPALRTPAPMPQATAPKQGIPLPQYHKNTPYIEQEISVSAFIEEYSTEKIDDTTLRIKRGGKIKYKFCIKEKKFPSEVWMLNFAIYGENSTPGGDKEVIILQINGASQENRIELGWIPNHEKNARGNITIRSSATIGGCENEFSLDALTGDIIIKGPIRIIRRM
jgi:hypothetical protein